MTNEKKGATSASGKSPLNLNDLASNPMRVGMERLQQEQKAQPKRQKKHWWSRKKK